MNFWMLMIKKEDYIFAVVNLLVRIKSSFQLKKQNLLRKMRQKSPVGIGRDTFIILNGPSIKNQDLSTLMGKSCIFVNRGFMHPLYKELEPEFHVIVDPKMLNGEWPVSWLDEIVEMVPNVTFVMPASWYFVDKFRPYIDKGISFYWLPDPAPCTVLGVAGSCFEFAIEQKFETIHFTGFDGNGLAFELINSASHFYGVNEDDLKKTTKNYVQDLFMFSRHLRDLNKFAERCKKKGINIINLTDGGLLDMFPRKKITEIRDRTVD